MAARFLPKDYVLIWLALVLMGLYYRPLTPVDETRAVSVAWDMWQRGDFLVPHLNGQPYSHKPPLLQWCIHALWLAFGVKDWCARLVAPLFALGNLVLTVALSRRLWPADVACERIAPLLLLALPVWALWTSLTLYDMLLTFFTLLGLLGVHHAAHRNSLAGWGIAGLAIGGGLLSKGPAILLMVLPSALLAPLWLEPKAGKCCGTWYAGLAACVFLGAVVALAWAIPAGTAGGDEYRRMILWGQSAGRVSQSFAHQHPFWWYLAILPVLSLPWFIWPPLWRSAKAMKMDAGLRFCAIHVVAGLLLFSSISGKQLHYLLPLFPTAALFAARILSLAKPGIARRDQIPIGLSLALLSTILFLSPVFIAAASGKMAFEIVAKAPLAAKWMLLGLGVAVLSWRPENTVAGVRIIALTMLAGMFGAHLIYRSSLREHHDLQVFADRLAAIERKGAPIAFNPKYNGDFNFLGRLRQPLAENRTPEELLEWMKNHPDGYVVMVRKSKSAFSEDGVDFAQYYRSKRRITLWKSSTLMDRMENSRNDNH